MDKTILLSFDVEEFDLPKENNINISDDEMFKVALDGLNQTIKISEKFDIKPTFFVTAVFALKHPAIIKRLSKKYEIACHGYSHSKSFEGDIGKAKTILEKIINKKVLGFRNPRLKTPDFKKLKELDFVYDSSINPTFIPLRYNNLNECRTYNFKSGIIEIPISTSVFRFPLFWLSFKNLPVNRFIQLSKFPLSKQGYLNLFFHPWEFTDISKFKIPFYIKRNSGEKMLNRLEEYILWCKKNNLSFKTFSEFIKDLE